MGNFEKKRLIALSSTAAGLLTAALLGACSDDDTTVAPSGKDSGADTSTGDSSTPPQDSGSAEGGDSSPPPPDGGSQDASDASDGAVTFIEKWGNTGAVRIEQAYAQAFFKVDDLIVRSPAAPECVVHIGSGEKPSSSAGDFTLGGDAVGRDGGIPAPQTIVRGPDNVYGGGVPGGQSFYNVGSRDRLQVAFSGTDFVAALPPTTVQGPAFGTIAVTSPTVPKAVDAGADADPPAPPTISVKTTEALRITWNVPADAGAVPADQKLIVTLFNLAATMRIGEIRCGFPLSRGSATIPAAVLKDLKDRLGPIQFGFIYMRAGSFTEVTPGGASYVIEVGEPTSFLYHDPGTDTDITELNMTFD